MALSAWAIAAIVVASLIVASFVYTKLTAPGFHVAGKHMFITGGNQGIGLAVAKKYAAAGARVTIAARNLTTLDLDSRGLERQALINGLSDGQFAITNELIISALRTIANGINPRGNTPLELLFLPFIVLFQLCYGFYVDRIVLRARDARRKQRSAPNARTSLVDDAPRKLS